MVLIQKVQEFNWDSSYDMEPLLVNNPMKDIKKAIEEAKYEDEHPNNYGAVSYRFTPKKLFTLLEMVAKKICKDTLLDNSEDGELFEDGFEADWVDYWNETLKALKE